MTFSVDPFLAFEYKEGLYNCFDFAGDFWYELTGECLSDRLSILRKPIAQRKARVSDVRGFRKLEVPESPCLVVLRMRLVQPHIGVFYEGRVLHLHSRLGVLFQPVREAAYGFDKIGFYK